MRYLILVLFTGLGVTALCQSKLSPDLEKRWKNYRTDLSAKDTFTLSTENIQAFQSEYQAEIEILNTHKSSNSLTVYCSYQLLKVLIEDTSILFIDFKRTPVEESFLSDPNFIVNGIRTAQADFPTLNGKDQIISIKEQLFDSADIDLLSKSKLIGTESGTISAHATDMATIISGTGNSSPLNLGVAPEAHISSSDFNNLLPDDESLLQENGVFTQNHAYGVGIENYYGVEAAAYDESVNNLPELVHIFSAGNSGNEQPENGTYGGLTFANLTGTFKQAKNTITVTGLGRDLQSNPANSIGPAYDGRLKPELTAYGSQGTSDAVALVSGIVALIQQKYFELFGSYPSMALIKSLLVAGAMDIGLEGIDYIHGYGNVNATKSIGALVNGQMAELAITKDTTSQAIEIDIPDNISEVRLAVSWVDPPASVNATKALVNNINSTLKYNGNEWLPWVLDAAPDEGALLKQAVRGIDTLNNLELISIEDPVPGTYTLNVEAPALSTSGQGVHIAWTMDHVDSAEWLYPFNESVIPANETTTILWESSFESPGSVSYRLNNGDWIPITATGDTFYPWIPPDTTAKAQLQVTYGENTIMSDTFFISKQPKLKVSFDCEERIGLEWNPVEGATSYSVNGMVNGRMSPIISTSDTTVSLVKSDNIYYSLTPHFAEINGLRTRAINYTFQGAFCYINFFNVQRYDEKTFEVKLSLSTFLGIKDIDIYKVINDKPQYLLTSMQPSFQTEFSYLDTELDPGVMTYQAVLNFEDGSSITSDLVSVFVEDPGKAILFPNPNSGIYLNVLSSGDGSNFQIIDAHGKLVVEKSLYNKADFLIIQDLRKGLYFYRLVKDGEILDSGKFIKYE